MSSMLHRMMLCVVAVSFAGDGVNGANIDSILGDWKKRREMMDSVRYVGTGEATVPRGAFNQERTEHAPNGADLPAADHIYPTRYSWLLDFKHGRIRREWNRQVFYHTTNEFIPDVKIESFDGRVRRRWQPRSENTSQTYTPSDTQVEITDNLYTVLSTADIPVLFAHGHIYLPTSRHDAGAFLNWPIKSDDLTVVGDGEYNDQRCVVLRSRPRPGRPQSYIEIWVDPSRDSAIVRWMDMNSGKTAESVEMDYELVEGKHWLPKELHHTLFLGGPPGIPVNSVKLVMKAIIPNVPVTLEDFQISIEKGMVVQNQQTGERYRYGESGELSTWGAFLLYGSLLFIVAAIVIAWNSKRQAKQKS